MDGDENVRDKLHKTKITARATRYTNISVTFLSDFIEFCFSVCLLFFCFICDEHALFLHLRGQPITFFDYSMEKPPESKEEWKMRRFLYKNPYYCKSPINPWHQSMCHFAIELNRFLVKFSHTYGYVVLEISKNFKRNKFKNEINWFAY